MKAGRRSIETSSPMHRKVQLLSDFLLVIFIILLFFSISMKLLLQIVILFMEECSPGSN